MYSIPMDLQEKLAILASAAKFDASCASSGSDRASSGRGFGAANPAGVCHSWTGDGRCVSLLKILYSNVCRLDCAYCMNRASNDIRRASFTQDEIVRLTLSFYKRNYIEGLFLSSGIFSDPDIVMERLIAVAKALRREHGFQGYIHLKAIPGCGEILTREAALWADRLSANIELPTEAALRSLAPQKDGTAILGSMRFLRDGLEEDGAGALTRRQKRPFLPAGQSTQLIVGATADSDARILRLSDALYRKMRLKRVYYSAFIPVVSDRRLPSDAPPLKREHRLYQADWLLRFYGFSIDDIVGSGDLDQDIDPKVAWALRHPEFFPVELRSASYERLLRVPGIGVIGARRILAARRSGGLRAESLSRLGISLKRAGFFVVLNGHPPSAERAALADARGFEGLRPLLSDGSDASVIRAGDSRCARGREEEAPIAAFGPAPSTGPIQGEFLF